MSGQKRLAPRRLVGLCLCAQQGKIYRNAILSILRRQGPPIQLAHMALMTIVVGTERFTVWEARREIVRRAIEYLENR